MGGLRWWRSVAAESIRDEQRKFIKYNHLVANLLIYHNVVTMTKALQQLIREGYQIDEKLVACLSPYQTEHVNRFGRYSLKRDRVTEPLDTIQGFRIPPQSERREAARAKASGQA